MKKYFSLVTVLLCLSNFTHGQFVISSELKISDIAGGFLATIDDGDLIGYEVESIGDLDGDGVNDIALGTTRDDDGATDAGAVYIVFLNSNGTVKDYQKISSTQGNFAVSLASNTHFGVGLASIGDVNNDGVQDIAVGAYDDNDGGTKKGAVYILFLNTDGTVNSYQKISDSQGNFNGILSINDEFGRGIAGIGDLNGDMVPDIAVGSIGDDDGGTDHGAVYILFLNSNGSVSTYQKISSLQGNFSGALETSGYFGFSIASMGDIDNDFVTDIAVTHRDADVNGINKGEVFILFMNQNGTVSSHQRITEGSGGFGSTLFDNERFGYGLENGGDLNNDGVNDLLASVPYSDQGGTDRGGFYILYLGTNGTVQSEQWFSSTQGGITGPIDDLDLFGASLAPLGDLNGDGSIDLIVGAPGDDDGGTDRGAVYVLFQQSTESLTEQDNISNLIIYPNPTSEDLTIQGELNVGSKSELKIADLRGKIVYENELKGKTFSKTIDIKEWSSGVYFLNISSEEGMKTVKLVKK